MRNSMLLLAVGYYLFAGPVFAETDISPAVKQVVQGAYLATLVPELCPAYQTDMNRFVGMMTTLHIQPEEMGVSGKFASIGEAVQLQFRAYADRNREKACNDAWELLGSERSVHLLIRKP